MLLNGISSCGTALLLFLAGRLLAADSALDPAPPHPLRPGPPMVGRLGVTSALEITGNRVIPKQDLRFGLAGSYEYLKAAHPSAPFKDYIAAVESLLVRGYQNIGFRDARASAVLSPDGARLRVQVVEGSRFLKGDVRILGADSGTARELVAALTGERIVSSNELALKVAAFVAKRSPPEPKPELAAAAAVAQQVPVFSLGTGQPGGSALASKGSSMFEFLTGLQSESGPSTAWKSGSPFSFSPHALEMQQEELTRILRERGQWRTRVKTGIEVNPATGRVDLVHTLAEMPSAVIGRIQVIGHERDTAAEIIAATGLKSGEPFTSETLREANLALWNTARFLNFDVVARPAAGGGAALDLTVTVQDCPDMQPLREPLTREQKALVKLAAWMTVELQKREYALHLSDSRGNGAVMAISPGSGLALLLNTDAPDQLAGLQYGPNDGLVVAASGKRAAARAFGEISSTLGFELLLTPNERDQATTRENLFSFATRFGLQYSDKHGNGRRQGGLKVNVLICPAALCSKTRKLPAPEMRFQDGYLSLHQVVGGPESHGKADSTWRVGVRFLEATGELSELAAEMERKDSDAKGSEKYSARLEFKPGEVRRIRQVLETGRQGFAVAQLAAESFVEMVGRWPVVERLINVAAKDGSGSDHDKLLRWRSQGEMGPRKPALDQELPPYFESKRRKGNAGSRGGAVDAGRRLRRAVLTPPRSPRLRVRRLGHPAEFGGQGMGSTSG